MPGLHPINVLCLDEFDLESETYEIYLFDGRNALDGQAMKNLGFDYHSIGRANMAKEPRYSPSA